MYVHVEILVTLPSRQLAPDTAKPGLGYAMELQNPGVWAYHKTHQRKTFKLATHPVVYELDGRRL